jgi:hypothetical protein
VVRFPEAELPRSVARWARVSFLAGALALRGCEC